MGLSYNAAFLSLAALSLTACANLNSIHRVSDLRAEGQIEMIDAKQRAIISVPTISVASTQKSDQYGSALQSTKFRVCAEAAPDVFSIYALAAAAEGRASLSPGEDAGRDLEGLATLSAAETASTIERTQTINLIRESMYRTCERYLSGAIGAETMQIQAARDQRAMVAILAIEQLTGVVKRRPTILSTQAQASLISARKKLIDQQAAESEYLATKQEAFEQAEIKFHQATSVYDELYEGKCGAIIQTPSPDLPEAEPDSSQTQTTTETRTTLEGGVESTETITPVQVTPNAPTVDAAKGAADFAEKKANCQGAHRAKANAETSLSSLKSARDAAKATLGATRELLAKLSPTALSASAGGQGDGDAGSNPTPEDITKVADTVAAITASTFDTQTELVYVCTNVMPTFASYKEPYAAQWTIIHACISVLNAQSSVLEAKAKRLDIETEILKIRRQEMLIGNDGPPNNP
jgi:hypothetical protein